MILRKSTMALAVVFGLGLAGSPALAQQAPPDHPGRGVYQRVCASCHDNPGANPANARAAQLASLQTLAPARLREALTQGVMAPIGATLSPEDLNQVIAYLTAGQQAAPAQWTDAILCSADKRAVDTSKAAAAVGFGFDLRSTRSLSAKQAGLRKGQMKDLDVAWTLAFPGQGGGTGPLVFGDTVFISGGGRMLALDAASGCAKWAYTANSRNTPALADIGGRKAVVFSAGRDIHAVDAATGALIWKASGQPENSSGGSIRGGVAVYKDKVIVPISASGVAAGMNARSECCDGHGSVVVLSAADGKRLWEWHTMPDATYNGFVNSVGVKQKGPSGAPIWSVPTIDEKRNRIIVTTGENTSHPGTDTSDAVIAIDLNTGKEVWKFQGMAADVWNMACSADKASSGPNCPWHFDQGAGRDFDFGAQAIIAKGGWGKDIVLAGQKSGHVWALDAETGKKLWEQRVGEGTVLGGVHWGIASDGSRVFAPISDPFGNQFGTTPKPGMFAFDIKNGKLKWAYDARPNCEGERGKLVANCEIKYGFSAAPIVVDGAVVAGTLGGEVFVFDGKTGKILKQIDTVGPKTTINPGVPGKGGSIDAHGLSAGAGMIFVNSGYGSFSQTPGNVLIALKPVKK